MSDILIDNRSSTPTKSGMQAFQLETYLNDHSPMPEDLIAPRLLRPGGLLILAGAPKVGKSHFMLSWLYKLACGQDFLGMQSAKPLRSYYCQSQLSYPYLRERIQALPTTREETERYGHHLYITDHCQLTLNHDGTDLLVNDIQHHFSQQPPDLLVFDPIRDVFDGGPYGNNDDRHEAMTFFLNHRIEPLRQRINPQAGVILLQDIDTSSLEDGQDPFNAVHGGFALRAAYNSGLLLMKIKHGQDHYRLLHEGHPPQATKTLTRIDNNWQEIHP